MLIELRICHFALVEEISLPFDPGLTVLTGSTGAGKSILVGAIGLLLGERAGVIQDELAQARVLTAGDIAAEDKYVGFVKRSRIDEFTESGFGTVNVGSKKYFGEFRLCFILLFEEKHMDRPFLFSSDSRKSSRHYRLSSAMHLLTTAASVMPYFFMTMVPGAEAPKWLMAAELVETTRLYARTAAAIEPEWIEPLAAHTGQIEGTREAITCEAQRPCGGQTRVFEETSTGKQCGWNLRRPRSPWRHG